MRNAIGRAPALPAGGLLTTGDLVVLHGGGTGATYDAITLRWGNPVTG
jgi:hypothetical protein